MTTFLLAACAMAHHIQTKSRRHAATLAARETAVIPAKAGIHCSAVRQDGFGAGT
jgi:hypothetical protein